MAADKFYITTAIDYVNSRPHLGTAYEKVTADVIARYKRLSGITTHFVMGNDEHSLNVYRRAQELGVDPLAYCDDMEGQFREVWKKLNISFDDFIRTTEDRHKAGVHALLKNIQAAGDIFEGDYEGWYCVSCEAFKTDADLEDGNCKIHNKKPDWIKEKNYFFKLSKYQDALLDLHSKGPPYFLEPESRRNEITNVIKGGLKDISISRASQEWGIPLPDDPNAVVYVWFDALINYISAVGYGTDDELFGKWWPAELHVIGKDITRFHCVIWPAMLLSAGVELPRQVFGHGWVNFQGAKMSKSDGTVIDPLEAADKYGPDSLRLYLVREIVYGNDGDFSWERFEERYNADLANNLGNLVSRIASMSDKYRDGKLAQPTGTPGELAAVAEKSVQDYTEAFDRYALHLATEAAFRLVNASNEYIAKTEPWGLAKDESKAGELSQVLYEVAEAVRIAAILLLPVLPDKCEEILRRVGSPTDVTLGDATWNAAGDRTTSKGDPLWPRLDKK